MSSKKPIVRITGDAADVIIVRPGARVTVFNSADPEDYDDLEAVRRKVIEGAPAQKIVAAEGDVEIEGEVADVIVVEGEAVIFNNEELDDDDDDDEEDDEED